MRRYPPLLPALVLTVLAGTGCAPLIVATGAATAVTVAQDRRTVGAFVDDEIIELKATSAINQDDELKREAHINVTSLNGIVLLTGEAPTIELRDRVLTKVRGVTGVRRTVNEIRVAAASPFSQRSRDSWLTGKVKSKLFAVKELGSSQIKVITENDAVYLMGLLNRQEAELATEAAREVGGIERVVKLFEYLD